jgi:hypothetical protein
MRLYILTKKEKELLKRYLEFSETSDSFWVLFNRVNKAVNILEDDITLIHSALKKYGTK